MREVLTAWALERREELRGSLPDCWKCGSPHWPNEACDDRGWPALKAIDWPRKS
jgi:hypothetical protein